MNSLIVGSLGAIDVYYVNKDVFLLASLAGWTDHVPAENHFLAAIALCCAVTLWIVHAHVLKHAR